MNSKRMSYVMIAALALLCVAIIGAAYLGSQMLTVRSNKLNDLKVQEKAYTTEQKDLVQAKEDVWAYSKLNRIAQAIVPQDKNQAQIVREITNIANASNISLSSITMPASTLGTAVPKPSSSSSAGSGTAASDKAADLTQLLPVKGIAGLYVLEITVTVDPQSPVEYSKFIEFLSGLEQNRRTAQVSSINLLPSPKDPNFVSFNLVLDDYIKP